jgi:BlaI family transcriptional regulator, penicillinase repressor
MPPKISSAEWEVMNVVWSRHPLTATEVFGALPQGHGWKQKTVNTFLTRLAGKGVLGVTREGKANVYTPLLKREDCVASEGASFLQRVFQGASGSLVMHFCENADLTPEEIRELEEILKNKKGRK